MIVWKVSAGSVAPLFLCYQYENAVGTTVKLLINVNISFPQ